MWLGWKTWIYSLATYSLKIKPAIKYVVKTEIYDLQQTEMKTVSCWKQRQIYHWFHFSWDVSQGMHMSQTLFTRNMSLCVQHSPPPPPATPTSISCHGFFSTNQNPMLWIIWESISSKKQAPSQGQPVTVVFSTDKNHCFLQKTIISKCSWRSDPW